MAGANPAIQPVVLDEQGICRYVTQSVHAALGLTEDMIVGRPYLGMIHPDDREALASLDKSLTRSGEPQSISFRMYHSDGALVWFEANFRLSREPINGHFEIVAVLRDVTQRKQLERELATAHRRLAQLATTDGLTGLANRRSFDAFLRDACAGSPVLSVLLIDIDNFKGFNDTLGHQAGDVCLREIAKVIDGATLNTGGQSARYGGEEFAIVLPGVPEERAMIVADSLRLLIRKLAIRHPTAPRGYVTISVGVAGSDRPGDGSEIVHEADLALYHAKESGRNCAVAASSLHRAETSASAGGVTLEGLAD